MSGVKLVLQEAGHLPIPEEYRKALGVKAGDELIVNLEEGALYVCTPEQALRRAREVVKRRVPADRNLVEELIEERRREAQLE